MRAIFIILFGISILGNIVLWAESKKSAGLPIWMCDSELMHLNGEQLHELIRKAIDKKDINAADRLYVYYAGYTVDSASAYAWYKIKKEVAPNALESQDPANTMQKYLAISKFVLDDSDVKARREKQKKVYYEKAYYEEVLKTSSP